VSISMWLCVFSEIPPIRSDRSKKRPKNQTDQNSRTWSK
jgi:hypothetical protein